MNRYVTFVLGFFTALALLWAAGFAGRERDARPATVEIKQGALTIWMSYPGRLESRREIRIASQLPGAATLTELVPGGTAVAAGDVLARFDTADLDREILKLEEEYTLSKADLESAQHGLLPIEAQEIAASVLTLRHELSREERYLEESIVLEKEGLVSAQEVTDQTAKVKELRAQYAAITEKQRLTLAYLHPATLQRAQARLHAAEQSLSLAKRKREDSVIRAPIAGVVIHPPIPAGGEFRPAQVGDTIYANQVFLALPDLQQLVAHCDIPEAELAQITAGSKVAVRPLASPGLEIAGTVATLGQTAQTVAGQPVWQQYFHATVELARQDPRLKPGMSATINILAYHAPEAVLAPRQAINWENGLPYAMVANGAFDERRELRLGPADHLYYQVLDGLEPGERVRAP